VLSSITGLASFGSREVLSARSGAKYITLATTPFTPGDAPVAIAAAFTIVSVGYIE
jgi:hypothetical protein